MVDWLVVWGVAQAAGLVFKPILEDLAKETAKDYTKDFFKDCLKKVIHLPEKDPLKEVYGKALTQFLLLVQQELERADYDEILIKEYVKPLKDFVNQEKIAATLGSAFNSDSQGLDIQIMARTWREMNLPFLPEEFDWGQISKRYLKRVKNIIKDDDKLQTIFAAQAQEAAAEQLKEMAGIPIEFDLRRYRESLRELYGNLRLESMDAIAYAYNELKLWNVFVPQNARECQEFLPQVYEIPKELLRELRSQNQLDAEIAEVELERYRKAYVDQPIRSVFEIVGDPGASEPENRVLSHYTVILGDPGAGKSTLLQYIALKWAERPVKDLPVYPIPLLIELRIYAQNRHSGKCNDILVFLHSGDILERLNQHQLEEWLKRGHAIAMFDGLDEVFDPALREVVVTDIHSFTNKYPKVQTIATSRWLGYKAQRLRDAGFRHFMLQDLTSEQIEDFIQRWHDQTFPEGEDKVRKRERLRKGITDSKAIQELAGNPLLLTMMAILNRSQELPRDRATLYEKASGLLLHQWDVEAKVLEDAELKKFPVVIDLKDKQAMLRQVAYQMQGKEKGLAGNLIRETQLEDILTNYLKTIKEVPQARDIARLTIKQLRIRNFILCYLGGNSYAFVHRTFLEYFCAWEFVWQFKETQTLALDKLIDDVFGKHWQDESWHEVLLLICGMIDAKFVGDIIEYLLEQKIERRDFISEYGYLKKEGIINLVLAANCLAEVRNRREIAPIGTRLLQLLKKEVEAEYPHRFDFEPATAILMAIAANWQDDPETLPWLKSCLQFDPESAVAFSAVRAIAQNWKDDPDTLILLKDRAQNDADSDVRRVAVQEFARGWKDDPDTLILLKDRVQNDADGYVRGAAVRELARGWKDDPDTLILLKDRVQNDADDFVRRVAVEELARGWKDTPGMFDLLCDRAVNDPFTRDKEGQTNPRKTALEAIVISISEKNATYR
jgi:predicted NACHT family NTPase